MISLLRETYFRSSDYIEIVNFKSLFLCLLSFTSEIYCMPVKKYDFIFYLFASSGITSIYRIARRMRNR